MLKHENFFSWQALLRIVAMGVMVILAWKALGVFGDILIALVLAIAFHPIVRKLNKKTKLPISLCIFLVITIPLIAFVGLGFVVIPSISTDVSALVASLNSVISHFAFIPSLQNINILQYIPANFDYVAVAGGVTSALFGILTVVFLIFYFLYDSEKLFALFLDIFPHEEKTTLKEMLEEVAVVVGKYVRGNVVISLICGVLIFVGLTILGIPYALPLSIFAAILSLLPLVGPTIGIIPAVIIGFTVTPMTGLIVLIFCIVYLQIENAVIAPAVYNKALNLYPSVSFISVVVGASLFGILGAFLALPVAASIPAIIKYKKSRFHL